MKADEQEETRGELAAIDVERESGVSGEFLTVQARNEKMAGDLAVQSAELARYERIIAGLNDQLQIARADKEMAVTDLQAELDIAYKAARTAADDKEHAQGEAAKAMRRAHDDRQKCAELELRVSRLEKDLERAREDKALGRTTTENRT